MASHPPATSRLYFRTWTRSDLRLAVRLWGDPAVTRLIDARERLAEADVLERLEREILSQSECQVSYWPMFKHDDDEFAGCAGLRPCGASGRTCEFGVQLMHHSWGLGLATEAGSAIITHAFGSLQLSSIVAGHHPANTASRSMLAKLGFSFTREELYAPTGAMHLSYVLRKGDWADV